MAKSDKSISLSYNYNYLILKKTLFNSALSVIFAGDGSILMTETEKDVKIT